MSHKTAYVWALLVWPVVLCVCLFLFPKLFDSEQIKSNQPYPVTFDLAPDGSSLVLVTRAASNPKFELSVSANGHGLPLMGKVETLVDRLKFVPAAPLVRGQRYRAKWLAENGGSQKLEFEFHHIAQETPTVRFAPQAKLPTNALKFYLHFSEPMEQGVFLERLKLLDDDGKEVIGPFRETELWSPDGKRLTIMFHPGRQKTGVNLNLDEGPVLIAGEGYDLVVSGQWRSTAGIALGRESAFHLKPIAADHEQPDPARWQIHPPKAGTLAPIVVITNELFDPQIFARALQVPQTPGKAEAKVIDLQRVEWRFTPEQPWKPGEHRITINPELEDLAQRLTWYGSLRHLTRDELRYVLDPKDVMGPDYPSETFRVLQKNEIAKHGEYRTQRLVLAAYDVLVAGGMRPRTEGYR
jgi:hypothetical protein